MDIGNIPEWLAVVVPVVGGGILAVWWAGRFNSRLDVHDSKFESHGRRIEKLETEWETLSEKLDNLKQLVIEGFAEIKVALSNKEDKD